MWYAGVGSATSLAGRSSPRVLAPVMTAALEQQLVIIALPAAVALAIVSALLYYIKRSRP